MLWTAQQVSTRHGVLSYEICATFNSNGTQGLSSSSSRCVIIQRYSKTSEHQFNTRQSFLSTRSLSGMRQPGETKGRALQSRKFDCTKRRTWFRSTSDSFTFLPTFSSCAVSTFVRLCTLRPHTHYVARDVQTEPRRAPVMLKPRLVCQHSRQANAWHKSDLFQCTRMR